MIIRFEEYICLHIRWKNFGLESAESPHKTIHVKGSQYEQENQCSQSLVNMKVFIQSIDGMHLSAFIKLFSYKLHFAEK